MPIAFDPKRTAELSLLADADLPAAQRPVLLFHFLTEREYDRVDEMIDAANAISPDTNEGDVQRRKAVVDIIKVALVGWRNFVGRDGKPVEYTGDPRDVLSIREMIEVASRFRDAIRLSEYDRKNSDSPPPSATAAAAAPETTATAASNPQPPSAPST